MSVPSLSPVLEQRRLRIFISYASEDQDLALTLATSLRHALGDFPQINYDKWFMQLGKEFRGQLQEKLRQSDILLIVFTGVTKSYSGWEVGFWEGVKTQSDPKLIPLYLGKRPEAVSSYEGVDLDMPHELLQLKYDDFVAQDCVPSDHPVCKFIKELQDISDVYRAKALWEPLDPRPDPRDGAKEIRRGVFRYLKGTIAEQRRVQQEITIEIPGAFSKGVLDLPKYATQLPPEVRLILPATGVADIPGLPTRDITWGDYAKKSGAYQEIWRDALACMMLSYLQGNLDSSQLVVLPSPSASIPPTAYLLILTTATQYFDGKLRFELYVVQVPDDPPYGNQTTTQVLKGLELVCRYRFMFLEQKSKFAWYNIVLVAPRDAQASAYELRRELALMRRDALRAGMDQPAMWIPYIDVTELQKMGEAYLPAEAKIQELVATILQSTDAEQISALQKQLSEEVRQLAVATEPVNAELINSMSKKLQELVQEERRNFKAN